MDIISTPWTLFLSAIAYVAAALPVMLLIDVTTNRVTRFIGNKPWRAYAFLLGWPLLSLYVFLPRYRIRRGNRRLRKPTPFVKA